MIFFYHILFWACVNIWSHKSNKKEFEDTTYLVVAIFIVPIICSFFSYPIHILALKVLK
jgi:hypothetical protein